MAAAFDPKLKTKQDLVKAAEALVADAHWMSRQSGRCALEAINNKQNPWAERRKLAAHMINAAWQRAGRIVW